MSCWIRDKDLTLGLAYLVGESGLFLLWQDLNQCFFCWLCMISNPSNPWWILAIFVLLMQCQHASFMFRYYSRGCGLGLGMVVLTKSGSEMRAAIVRPFALTSLTCKKNGECRERGSRNAAIAFFLTDCSKSSAYKFASFSHSASRFWSDTSSGRRYFPR